MSLPAFRAHGLALLTLCAASICTDAVSQRQQIRDVVGSPPDLSNWPHPAAPDGNPFPRSTASAAELQLRDDMVQLGKALFWDEQVSTDNTVACGTCHMPRAGGTDDRPGAVHANGNFGTFGVVSQQLSGGQIVYGAPGGSAQPDQRAVTDVAAPSAIGAYMFDQLFWDKRAGPDFKHDNGAVITGFSKWAALEALSVGPPTSDVEMGHHGITWASGYLQNKIGDAHPLALVEPGTIPQDVQWLTTMQLPYAALFDLVFQNHSNSDLDGIQGVTRERFAAALAHYQRTLIPDQAPIDTGNITAQMEEGFEVLRVRGCFECHSATEPTQLVNGKLPNSFDNLFSDGTLHPININNAPDRKTPTLRNLGLRKKFFSTGHGGDGTPTDRPFVGSRNELLDFYVDGPGRLGFDGFLSETDRAAVEAFLFDALTDPRVANEQFPFDRPMLRSEMDPFEANEYGAGSPASDGITPEIIANYPPLIPVNGSQSNFRVGMSSGFPGAVPFLMVTPAAGTGAFGYWVSGPMVTLPGSIVDANGMSTVHYSVPADPALKDVPSFVQWIVLEPNTISFTNAAHFTPFYF